MRRILVTGGSGFIGRYVCRELERRGYQVRILDALIEQVHQGTEISVSPGTDLIHGDMRDAETVKRALDGVDGVIHLAAEVGVGQSMYEIARYVGANDLGTAVLLEAMIDTPVRKIVVASSMSVYGEGTYHDALRNPVPLARRRMEDVAAGRWEVKSPSGEDLVPAPTAEDKPVDLASIYALTKYAQERQVLIFGQAYEIDAVALRLFNVFGPGQALSNPYTGVLANFASRLASGRAPMVFEDGEQKRDFVHVSDVARAFCQALENPAAAGHAINVGSGRAYTIAEVARLLAREMGVADLKPEIIGKFRKGDIRNCFADISKARELLGFQPENFLENSLGDFTEWVSRSTVVDNGPEMRRQLETRRLVS